MGYLNTTGKRITFLRQIRGKLLQKQLAQLLLAHGVDVQPSFLSQIESDRKSPSISMLRALALVLETTTDYILCLTDNPERIEDEPIAASYITPEAEAVANIVDELREQASREHVLRVAEFMGRYEEAITYRMEAERRQRNQSEWASMLAELERLEGKPVRDRIEKELLSLASGAGTVRNGLSAGAPKANARVQSSTNQNGG